jgi:hypothetical protein
MKTRFLLTEDKLRSLGFEQVNDPDEWLWGIRTDRTTYPPDYVPIIKYNNKTKIATVEVGSGSFTKKVVSSDTMLKLVDTASFIIGFES